MRITIENKVYGSQQTVMGDGVLSYSKGISPAADSFGTLFTGRLSPDYASLYFLNNPDNGLHTVIHVQGAFTQFKEQGRAYDMRAIYELSESEFHRMENLHAPLIAALDKFHPYASVEYGSTSGVEVDLPLPTALSENELLLRQCMIWCVVHNRQLFIRLGNDEDYRADQLRYSRKLQQLLHALDTLPKAYRGFASMGFSVDSTSNGTRTLADHLLIIAHHDDISLWGKARQEGVLIDWTTSELRLLTSIGNIGAEEERITEVSPLLHGFLGSTAVSRTQVSEMFELIPNNIDQVLRTRQLDRNSLLILAAAFRGGKETYRHFEVARKILPQLLHGVIVGDLTIADILNVYPDLREDLRATDWVSCRKIVEALRENGVKDIGNVVTLDVDGWDIRTLDPTAFDELKELMNDTQLQTLRQKALPYYYEQVPLRCVFEHNMTHDEALSLLNHLWKTDLDHFTQFLDEQKVLSAGEVERARKLFLNTKLPHNFGELMTRLREETISADAFEALVGDPDLLVSICESPRKLTLATFSELYTSVSKRQKELPVGLFDDALSIIAQNFLNDWFRNTKVWDSQYVKTVVPACKKDRQQEQARQYLLSQWTNFSESELVSLRNRFVEAYNHRPQQKNRKEYSHKLSALSTATEPLLKALRENKVPAKALSEKYKEYKSLANWFRIHFPFLNK